MGMLDFLRGLGGAVIGKDKTGFYVSKRKEVTTLTPEQKILREAKIGMKDERWKQRVASAKRAGGVTKFLSTGQTPIGGITKGSASVYNPRTGKMEKTGGTKYMVAGISYAATRSKGVSVKSPGRPRLSFKPRPDPVTGRLIRVPANIYYKRARYAKRINSASYQRKQLQKAQFYQRRGIPPQQAAQIEMVRQQRAAQQLAQAPQQVPQQQMQMPQRQMPQQRYMPPQRYIPQQMRTDTNFFTGGVSTLPKERWLQ